MGWLLWRRLLIWAESDGSEDKILGHDLWAQRLQSAAPAEVIGQVLRRDAMEGTQPFLEAAVVGIDGIMEQPPPDAGISIGYQCVGGCVALEMTVRPESGVVQIRVTPEARQPLVGAALARSGVTRKQHFLNHARSRPLTRARHPPI